MPLTAPRASYDPVTRSCRFKIPHRKNPTLALHLERFFDRLIFRPRCAFGRKPFDLRFA